MKHVAHCIKGCIFPILASTALLFLLIIPAYATKPALEEPTPTEEALSEKGAVSPEAQAMTAAASSGTGISPLGTEFYGAGASIIEASNNIYAGAAKLNMPITVLPGRVGVAPNINLTYSSLGGNGFPGVGWLLDMGSVQCRTKDGLAYPCNDFIFTKGGSTSDLVYKTGTTNEYSAKIDDGSIIKFFKNGSGSNTYWTAYDKNGMLYTYGTTSGAPSYSRLDDATGAKIFKWRIKGSALDGLLPKQ